MTVYRSHRQKNITKKIRTYIIVLILLVIFFFTIGIKILINTSLFISDLTSQGKNNSDQVDQNDNYLPTPEIYNLPDATNSATLDISGRAIKNKKLRIIVNEHTEDELILKNDEFTSVINLKAGENEIYLVLTDAKTKKGKESDKYKVTFLNKPPTLEIISPASGAKTNKDEVVISGQTDVGVNIKIGASPSVTDSSGKFSYLTKLQEGENTIKIVATDIAGNTREVETKVIYEKD